MLLSVLSAARIPLMAGLVALGLGAYGRRGPPEAPPVAVAPAQTGARVSTVAAGAPAAADEGEAGEALTTVVPTPRPARNPRRGYTIPTEPFILDPLL